MESRFEVGDKVIVARKGTVWNMEGKMDKWLGRVMTIGYKDMDSYQMEEDQDENDGEGWWWSDDNLEPAEYAVELVKIGDKMVAKNLISGETAEVYYRESNPDYSAKIAIETLHDKEFHVGDKVKIVNSGALYTTYPEWVVENVEDKLKIAMYAYGKDIDTDKTYTILAIAPHQTYKSEILMYIEGSGSWGNNDCFLIGAYGIKKV